MNTAICSRLYDKLKIQGGKRQFVLTGSITDMFFADSIRGVCRNIEEALLYYAVEQGYEIAFAIDDKMTLRFAAPEMQTKYQNIIDRKSEDPQKKQGSVKRGQSGASAPQTDANNQPDTVSAAQQVQTNAQSKAQQIFDGIQNRLLPHHTKSFVILSFAEKILEYGQNGTLTPASEQKIKTVREWAKAAHGNAHSCSILLVDDTRLEEFERASDFSVAGLEHRTVPVTVETPSAAEIEAMLIRLQNRYALSGNARRIAKAEAAKKQILYNIVETVKTKMKAALPPKKLEDLFEDNSVEKRKQARNEAEQELAALVGLQTVKTKISELIHLAEMIHKRQEQGRDTSAFSLHSLLIGNPGTGKTVVARILAKFYFALGLRRTDKVVEISVADITSEYMGEASVKLRDKIDEAMGGVLFIDEIYQFADNQQLKEAFENVLMKTMEDHRDELTVLGAGYGGEVLQKTLKINPGVARRFAHPDNTIEFPDYKAEELLLITERMLQKEHFQLPDEVRLPLQQHIEGRIKTGKMENANAGGARNLVETMIKNAAKRGEYKNIAAGDIPTVQRSETIDDILAELNNNFTGLQSVKDQIKMIAKQIAYDEREGQITDSKFNMQFIGNPGTGKTTIARYMSRVFNAVGLIEGTDVIEVAGTELKGSYLGQSKDAVIQRFEKAREEGKVLFIDEAHNLYNKRDQDSYAKEVIAQIVQATTAVKYARVFTILAGYPEPMKELMNADAGLSRRFPEQLIVSFPDYTTEECLQILCKRLGAKKFTLSPEAAEPLCEVIVRMKEDPKFGNAGTMANLADHLFDKHLERDDTTKIITIEDVEKIR
ncbi:MAG: AAA family ATPase [Planctomycetaceae bacterium]|jgi:SpoVK/Ycf46/Vps4 family AAA+-type ATPase|nr:AAA family ATPase [Planctomycetaceae bacterium]